jgi:hypothetical protein
MKEQQVKKILLRTCHFRIFKYPKKNPKPSKKNKKTVGNKAIKSLKNYERRSSQRRAKSRLRKVNISFHLEV